MTECMTYFFSPGLTYSGSEFEDIIRRFHEQGTLVGDGTRNVVKYFNINGRNVNFKSFKEPNLFNKIVYRYFRKSKARRSFENARYLLSCGLQTPEPLAYLEYNDLLGLHSSYYICRQLDNVVELRNVINDPHYPERENIIKAYTRYFFSMHEKGIEFLDNSPGNSLVEKEGDQYKIFLVDLNRMNFKKSLSLGERMGNFARLTTDAEVMRTIANEYALLSNHPFDDLYARIIANAGRFKKQKSRKKSFKKKLRRIRDLAGISGSLPVLPDLT
ncbi:MAG: lipopolysaccharide kinase [Chitinophagaceae bacterium]|nr:MAG: lipopolysaccharide kinase [Chitinophagaceae bacterium]